MEPVCQKPPIAGWFHIAMRLQHSFWTAGRTPAGYEAMAMVRKGKSETLIAATSGPGLIAGLFHAAAQHVISSFGRPPTASAKFLQRNRTLP
jgi:hypothetical protein